MPKDITTTVTVYSYAELKALRKDGKVTEKVLERAREELADGFEVDFDCTMETWTDALDQIGFEDAKIRFTGFWSQGDGASFLCNVDVLKLIEFMSHDYPATQVISISPISKDPGGEDFRGWITHQVKGIHTNPKYSKLSWVVNYIDAEISIINHHYDHERSCKFSADLRGDTGEIDPEYGFISNHPKLNKLFDAWIEDVEDLRLDICRAIYRDLEQEYEYQHSEEYLADLAEANGYWFTINGKIHY